MKLCTTTACGQNIFCFNYTLHVCKTPEENKVKNDVNIIMCIEN